MLVKTDTVVVTGDLGNQSGAEQVQAKFLAGPTSGSADYPTYRDIVANDLPGGSPTIIGAAFLPPIGGFKALNQGIATANEGYGGTPWATGGSVGTITNVAPTATLPVAINFTVNPNTAGNGAAISPNITTASSGLGSLKSIKFNFRLSTTTNIAVWCGLTDPLTSANIATAFKNNNTPNQNFVGFRFSTKASDLAWKCVTQTGSGSQTVNTSGVGVDTTNQHEYEIQFDGTNAVFFIDGVQVGSQSGTIPATSVLMSAFMEVDNAGNAGTPNLDIYSYRWINNF